MSTSELRANCMASDNRKPELEDAPLSFKSQVWENFGFQVNYHNGERRVDKSKAVCRHCSTVIVSKQMENTSNMHKIFMVLMDSTIQVLLSPLRNEKKLFKPFKPSSLHYLINPYTCLGIQNGQMPSPGLLVFSLPLTYERQ